MERKKNRGFIAGSSPSLEERLAVAADVAADPVIGPLLAEARKAPTVEEALTLARAIYARPGGSAGCCLHLVLDDDNCRDGDVAFCVGAAFLAQHSDCLHLACMLAAMNEADREAVAAEAWRAGQPWPAEVQREGEGGKGDE